MRRKKSVIPIKSYLLGSEFVEKDHLLVQLSLHFREIILGRFCDLLRFLNLSAYSDQVL